MVYDVNVAPILPKNGIQVLDFLSQLGYYKAPEGKDDFVCTTTMIDAIAENIKSEISSLTTFQKVDLGIALMIIPIPPALELANKCLEDISKTDFKVACHDLAISTDYFEKYGNNKIEFVDESNFAIGIIARYLHPITAKMKDSGNEFRKKFQEIIQQISKDMYGSGSSKSPGSEYDSTNLPWTKIELTTCGKKGRFGPSLKNCISTYNFDWSKNKTFFDVDPNRKGIQKIKIVRSGRYEIKAWGAGGKKIKPTYNREYDMGTGGGYGKTGSGNGFRINYQYYEIQKV